MNRSRIIWFRVIGFANLVVCLAVVLYDNTVLAERIAQTYVIPPLRWAAQLFFVPGLWMCIGLLLGSLASAEKLRLSGKKLSTLFSVGLALALCYYAAAGVAFVAWVSPIPGGGFPPFHTFTVALLKGLAGPFKVPLFLALGLLMGAGYAAKGVK